MSGEGWKLGARRANPKRERQLLGQLDGPGMRGELPFWIGAPRSEIPTLARHRAAARGWQPPAKRLDRAFRPIRRGAEERAVVSSQAAGPAARLETPAQE